MAVARNFVFLTPELGQHLRDHALGKVQVALDEYTHDAPYWFVTNYEAAYNEITLQHLYDYNALFGAKAMVLDAPREELARYLDVPGFARGDLFYIENLVLTLEAPPSISDIGKAASRAGADAGEVLTYTLTIRDRDASATQAVPITVTDSLPTGLVYYPGLCASSWGDAPACSARSIRWQGTLSGTTPVVISYTAQVILSRPAALTNRMRVEAGAWGDHTRRVTIIANPQPCYLPIVRRWR
jgi:uncharacterized repeat protein (TIGR01451 family)